MAAKLEGVEVERWGDVEKQILIQTLDHHWKDHLATLDALRQVIHLRSYAQKKPIVGSLLLGLYTEDGLLHHVGFCSAIPEEERAELTPRLEKLRKAPGFTGSAPGGPSRWSTERSTQWEPLDNKLVVEVPGTRGARVSARAGYYAPRPYEELHPMERNLLASEAIAAAAPETTQKPGLFVLCPGWSTALNAMPLTTAVLPVWVNVPFHSWLMVPCTVIVTCQVTADAVLFVTVRVAQ